MEIEIRAKVLNQSSLLEGLRRLNGLREKEEGGRQIDSYFRHEEDTQNKSVIRIRKNYESDSAVLTFKGSSKNKKNGDIAWDEYNTLIKNPEKLESLLLDNGYVYVCLIDKLRQSFSYQDYEINIDNVRDLGLFIEVERMGRKDEIKKIRKDIIGLLDKIGIKESSVIEKGYVPLMIESQKDY